MKRGWPFLLFFCAFALAACAGTTDRTASDITPKAGIAGDYLERQRFELQVCLGRFPGTEVRNTNDSVAVLMNCDGMFDPGSARLSPSVSGRLDDVAEILNKYSETKIRVDAHTDCIKSEEENFILSEKQAGAVKEALANRGVLPSRIIARGWGEAKPIASNATEAGRQENRRLTITLVPNYTGLSSASVPGSK